MLEAMLTSKQGLTVLKDEVLHQPTRSDVAWVSVLKPSLLTTISGCHSNTAFESAILRIQTMNHCISAFSDSHKKMLMNILFLSILDAVLNTVISDVAVTVW